MGFSNLSNAEEGVIKAVVRKGGSTSEGLAYAFVSGDLSQFTGNYRNFYDAWQRLGSEWQQAVIDVRKAADIPITDWGKSYQDLTIENFIPEFTEWVMKRIVNRKETYWYNRRASKWSSEEPTDEQLEKWRSDARKEVGKHLK